MKISSKWHFHFNVFHTTYCIVCWFLFIVPLPLHPWYSLFHCILHPWYILAPYQSSTGIWTMNKYASIKESQETHKVKIVLSQHQLLDSANTEEAQKVLIGYLSLNSGRITFQISFKGADLYNLATLMIWTSISKLKAYCKIIVCCPVNWHTHHSILPSYAIMLHNILVHHKPWGKFKINLYIWCYLFITICHKTIRYMGLNIFSSRADSLCPAIERDATL